ncbi:MAG: hypothetical protein ACERNK_15760, partial [Deltaproteobacteria bacterium]
MAARGSPPPAEGPTIIVLATDGEGNAPYWRGNDAQSLEAAFTTIISDSISCDIQMDKPFDDETKACNDPESD